MRKLICIGTLLFVLLFIAWCAHYPAAHAKIFSLVLMPGEEPVQIVLPEDFPDMDVAIQSGERCWDGSVCVRNFCLGSEPEHDHVDIWYHKTRIVALVWIKEMETDCEKRYRCWLYLEEVKIPIPIAVTELNALLNELRLGIIEDA